MMSDDLKQTLKAFTAGTGRLTVLTGAGISAESGIPTFRGPEGYWTVGSGEYHPQEMATFKMFTRSPAEVWTWYLYRRGVCRNADPNDGHKAVVEMENRFKDRFSLITQNVDGLHLRAGNSLKRICQIHGNVFYMRCADACTERIVPIPEALSDKQKGDRLTEAEQALLKCPQCGGWFRPHVLWFDETYNEEHFYFFTSLKIAAETALLLVAGTSGATNLPSRVAWEVKRNGGTIIDVNIEENVFSSLAADTPGGGFIKAPSGTALPEILRLFDSH